MSSTTKYDDYQILEDKSTKTLEKHVNNYLMRGYIPLGGVKLYNDSIGTVVFVQTIALPHQ